jgi:hypothetical protein
MNSKRVKIMIVAGIVLMLSVVAMSVLAQSYEAEQKVAAGVIQYRLVPIPDAMTQAQFQAVLTTQGNAGWRLQGPYVVGTGPIPDQQVLLFTKP